MDELFCGTTLHKNISESEQNAYTIDECNALLNLGLSKGSLLTAPTTTKFPADRMSNRLCSELSRILILMDQYESNNVNDYFSKIWNGIADNPKYGCKEYYGMTVGSAQIYRLYQTLHTLINEDWKEEINKIIKELTSDPLI